MPFRSALLAVALVAVCAAPADAAWRVRSPDGRVTAGLRLADGLRMTVRHGDHRVLRARIGLRANGRCVPAAPAGRIDAAPRTVEQRYTTPFGKRRVHHAFSRELFLRFHRGRSYIQVVVHASDDGVAFRTGVQGPLRRRVTGECSAFSAPRDARAWLQRYGTSYERTYDASRLRDAREGAIGFPALLHGRRAWTLLTEGEIGRGQSASRLRLQDGALRVEHVRDSNTPWRIAVVGSLATIVGSDLVEDLATGPRRDWSWVRPGRVAWSWWSDSASPASLERQRQYVDFAARMGWEYVLVDEGWDPAWMPALVAYARERGVGVLVWSRWDAVRTPAQRDALLTRWAGWGVAGVKLDFMESDSVARMAWYRDVARAAAKRRLVVNFHGSTVPRGLSRTWPNVLTQEAVRGAEHYKGDTPVTPAHNTTLPFTRGVIGPMDYTPVTFSAERRRTSLGHELALSVVYASGLQHFADSPEAYAAQPLAEAWLRDVPVAWDDTRLLAGRPGRSATIARRSGERWYVGAIRAGAARAVDLPLRFLAPGRAYTAEMIEDAPGAVLAARMEQVTAADALRLSTAANGGYVVRLTPVAR